MFLLIVSGSLLISGIIYVLYVCYEKQERFLNLFGNRNKKNNSINDIIYYNEI
jgi:hypothetical protein